MPKFVKIILYVSFFISFVSNFLLYKNIKIKEAELNQQAVMFTGANDMYQYVTNCEFVPPAFNPPLYVLTKDEKEVGMNVRHIFEDRATNVLTEQYQTKTDKIIDILEKEIKKYTLDDLKANKSFIEESVINTYNSQTIEPVTEFSILELCI